MGIPSAIVAGAVACALAIAGCAGLDEAPAPDPVAQRIARNEAAAIEAMRDLANAYAQSGDAPPLSPEMGGDDDGTEPSSPLRGYFFRVLPADGGFTLLGYPARHGSSGTRTFAVNQAGLVLAKDLGPRTLETARAMAGFRPDRTWAPVPGE